VNPSIYTIQDFLERLRAGNHFLRSIEKGKKVFLIGGEEQVEACLRKMHPELV
jgi:hypothetical protein